MGTIELLHGNSQDKNCLLSFSLFFISYAQFKELILAAAESDLLLPRE